MKSTYALFLILFSNSYISKAQDIIGDLRVGFNTSLEKNISSTNMSTGQETGYEADYNKINYRLGLNLEYSLTDNLSLNGSLNYSNKNFAGTFYCHKCGLIPQGVKNNDFRFIEIPLTLKYYFLPGSFRLFGELGLNNLFLLSKDLIAEYSSNTYILGIKIGSGIEYKLNQKFSILIPIEFNSSISPIYKESDFRLKSIVFGVGVMKRL